MEYLNLIVLIAAGLFFIIKGADWFVDSASWLARVVGVPEIIIGATIVSLGTTLPELISSLTAAIMGASTTDPVAAATFQELAVNNAAGSMLCNTALILALVMLIRPPRTDTPGFITKGLFLIVVTLVLAVFATTGGRLELYEGIILLSLFVVFMAMNVIEGVRGAKNNLENKEIATERLEAKKEPAPKNILKFILGAGLIAGGAIILVNNAESLCARLNIPGQIVGITVVAVGTSLPELVTSMTALKKGKTNIGVGNIIGANIINATLILGSVSAIAGTSGLPIDWISKNIVVWLNLAVMSIFIIPSIFTKKAGRIQGGILLALYVGMMIFNIVYVVTN